MKWAAAEETFPFTSAMTLSNPEAYPDYKLPLQLVTVDQRIELDEVDSESAIEITDPDAISYKCKLLLCGCTDLDKHVGWDKAFDAMKEKPWVPELGAGRRPLEMELSQSQLLFAPGELALTRAKKINKRNYRVVKQVLDACNKN